jgi:hypothetical protein
MAAAVRAKMPVMSDPTATRHEGFAANAKRSAKERWEAKLADDRTRQRELQDELSAVESSLDIIKRVRRRRENKQDK